MCFREVFFLISLESDGCGEVLKEEAQAALLLVKNEGSRTTEGNTATFHTSQCLTNVFTFRID